uniref:Uncharacterized protein n=1 Tax=Oryza rufipogon TaxID=4529 RepID=A0A0E0NA31_ORYRU
MLLDDTSSSGKPPDNELRDKFSLSKPVRSPRDGEMLPSRPLDAREITSTTAPFPLQVMPSQVQQSVPFCHDTPRPPSFDSPERNWRRDSLSCSDRQSRPPSVLFHSVQRIRTRSHQLLSR